MANVAWMSQSHFLLFARHPPWSCSSFTRGHHRVARESGWPTSQVFAKKQLTFLLIIFSADWVESGRIEAGRIGLGRVWSGPVGLDLDESKYFLSIDWSGSTFHRGWVRKKWTHVHLWDTSTNSKHSTTSKYIMVEHYGFCSDIKKWLILLVRLYITKRFLAIFPGRFHNNNLYFATKQRRVGIRI